MGVSASSIAVPPPAHWWPASAIAAWLAKGAASYAAGKVNLVNPGTHDLITSTPPTWDAVNGFGFDGLSQYLDTTVIPDSGWSALIRFSNRSGGVHGYGSPFGTYNGDQTRMEVFTYDSDGNTYFYNGDPSDTHSMPSLPSSGVFALAGSNAYFNGTPVASGLGSWSGTGVSVWIGARNNRGSGVFYCLEDVQAFCLVPTILSAGDVATVSAAMAAM
jgi:hypothetical protein